MKKILVIIIYNLILNSLISQTLDEQAAKAKKIANTGKIEEAKDLCEAILLKNPNHGATNVVYAMINEYQKNYELAELHYITAGKTIKNDPDLYFRLANLMYSLPSKDPTNPNYKYQTAMAYVDKAKAIAPKLNTVYLMYADIAKMYNPGQQITSDDKEKKQVYIKNMEKYIEFGGNDCESLSYVLGNFKSDMKLDLYTKGCAYLFDCSNAKSGVNYTNYVVNNALDYIWQAGDYVNCLKLAKFILSKKTDFAQRARAKAIACY